MPYARWSTGSQQLDSTRPPEVTKRLDIVPVTSVPAAASEHYEDIALPRAFML